MLPDRRVWIEDPELQEQERLLQRLFEREESLTFFDVGACEGESSVRYARLFPQATVYAAEPLPANAELVRRAVSEWDVPNMVPLEVCLAHRAGEMTFHVSAGAPPGYAGRDVDYDFGNKSSSLLAPEATLSAYPWLEFPHRVRVATERLDHLAERLGLNHIDFLHLDVQGAELLVLRGARDLLPRIRTVWLEVEDVPLYKGQPLRADVQVFMERRGFVKLLETWGDATGDPYGDQFWAQRAWLVARKGWAWTQLKTLVNANAARRTGRSRGRS